MKSWLLLPLFISISPQIRNVPEPVVQRPKNIILLIGDGMGLSQVSAGLYANGKKLNIDQFPVTGIMTTHAYRNLVTDSAAGATAFACGCKTKNGVIGLDSKMEKCFSILEDAEAHGLSTGLVASCSITHATPAAFIAHVESRTEHEAIAADILKTDVDLLIGGGLKYFKDRSNDSRNLLNELQDKGYTVSDYEGQPFPALTFSAAKPLVWFGAYEEPLSVTKGRDWLPQAAIKAPVFLKQRSDKGFFLMLEGSQIDWAGHANDANRVVKEMLDFDAVVGKILDFAKEDGQTLVIITADHETGGLALEQGHAHDSLDLTFSSTYHTASLVPVYAYGPGSESFSGVMDNTEIYWKMKALLGF
ncbi:MAG: alkaline phosphatase [Lewinellaceae bacterium]|nr:alkaline phosphatase [Lewinellaceae bacterium]